MLPRGILLVLGEHVLLRGVLLGFGISLISIAIYLYWLFHGHSGQGIYDQHVFVRRPAVFAYGVAIGICLVSTIVLLGFRAIQTWAEPGARPAGV